MTRKKLGLLFVTVSLIFPIISHAANNSNLLALGLCSVGSFFGISCDTNVSSTLPKLPAASTLVPTSVPASATRKSIEPPKSALVSPVSQTQLVRQNSSISRSDLESLISLAITSALASYSPPQATKIIYESRGGSNVSGVADSLSRAINSLRSDMTNGTLSITGGSFSGNITGTASLSDLTVSGNLTSASSTFTNATSTNFGATVICLTGDNCRTTWPSGGVSFGQSWELSNSALAPTTSVPILVNNATSTITNLVLVNATSTNATTTNLNITGRLLVNSSSSTINYLNIVSATSTGLSYATGGLIVNAASSTINNLNIVTGTITNGTITNASTTALSVSGALMVNSGSSTINYLNLVSATTTGLAYHTGGIIVNSASSSINNLDMINSTSTNATGTALYISGSLSVATTSNVAVLGVNAPAGRVSFTVGSSSATSFIINSIGNVAIGTSSANAKLEVSASSSGATSDTLFLTNSARATSTASRLSFRTWTTDNNNLATTTAAITGTLTGSFYTGTSTLSFSTLNLGTLTEAMRLDYLGRLGIGTTSPFKTLSVAGSANITGNVESSFFKATSTLSSTFPYASTTALDVTGAFVANNASSTITYLTGISATTTGLAYHTGGIIVNSASSSITFLNLLSATSTGLSFFTGGIIVNNASSTIRILNVGYASSTALDVIGALNVNNATSSISNLQMVNATTTATTTLALSAGTVGVGTSTPWAYFAINPIGGVAQNRFVVGSSSETSFVINNTGKVYIATTSVSTTSPATLFVSNKNVAGDVATFWSSTGECTINPTLTSLGCTSDVRKKKNIVPLASALETVLALKPVTYKWITGLDDATHTGFIAQDVEQLMPDLISTDDYGYKLLNYAGFAPYIVSAIQAQQLEINNLIASSTFQTSTSTISNAIAGWFASLGGAIENSVLHFANIVVDSLSSHVVYTQDIYINGALHIGDSVCVDSVCVSKDEFKQMLISNGGTISETNNTSDQNASSSDVSSTDSIGSSQGEATSSPETSQYTGTTSQDTLESTTTENTTP